MLGGLAGDMFLAAALDTGLVDRQEIERALSGLGFGDIEVVPEETRRGAIVGAHIEFSGWPADAESDHRHLSSIIDLLEASDLPGDVTDRAIAMFRTLGRSESDVHGIPLEDVHFHECGALDSIFDFVAAAWIIERTGVDSWSCGPVPLGSGTVETDHGTVPVPVPATAKLLDGFDTVTHQVEAELVTPTGATILRTLREISPSLERRDGQLQRDGYGAGTRQLDALSNVVRMLVVDPSGEETDLSHRAESDEVVRLTADIDDMSPEHVAEIEEPLEEAGALDVVVESVGMKKGRRGIRVAVLAPPAAEASVAEALFRHTTTFGMRRQRMPRWKLDRRHETVETDFGDIPVKLGYLGDELLQVSPELEDCRRAARRHEVPVARVHEAALAVARGAGEG
jgi:uncharacterized protein (TIGR00299 family) protein